MTTRQTLQAAFTALAAAAVFTTAQAGGNHDHSPKHGGIVAESKAFDAELVAKPDLLTLYLRDHDKPKSAAGASAKVTLLEGSKKTEVELKPSADGSKLEAKGSFPTAKGVKALAAVSVGAKPLGTVRFVLK